MTCEQDVLWMAKVCQDRAKMGARWTKIGKDGDKMSQNDDQTAEDGGKLADRLAILVHIGHILRSSCGIWENFWAILGILRPSIA